MAPARVRFAPSPTGGLHIGGLRTALYNYLLARQTGGTMILRIEDTDQSRFVPGAEDYIQECLGWVGIQIDEGPKQGGEYGPYRQSERKSIYQSYIQNLIDAGKAYYAFDSAEDLEAMRSELKNEGSASQQYDYQSRLRMKNSLTLSQDESEKLIQSKNYVIRMKVDPGQKIILDDLIRGRVEFDSAQVDDKVLMKSDGMPTYHLANVVDDHLMKITHVIRGEEWLPSAPLHVLLYKAFGWESTMPKFSHLPLLLKPDGKGKLSKRDADQLGFPIFPLDWRDPSTNELIGGYREAGYLPEAMVNFLVFLGWNPGGEQEIFSLDELIQIFSLERVGKSGARFDIQKAKWFNQQYLRAKSSNDLASILLKILKEKGINCERDRAIKIAEAMKERITFPNDLYESAMFYFNEPQEFDEAFILKKWNDTAKSVLTAYAASLIESEPSKSSAGEQLELICGQHSVKPGSVLQLLRIALTGNSTGPDLMLTIEILGGKVSANRIQKMLKKFSEK